MEKSEISSNTGFDGITFFPKRALFNWNSGLVVKDALFTVTLEKASVAIPISM